MYKFSVPEDGDQRTSEISSMLVMFAKGAFKKERNRTENERSNNLSNEKYVFVKAETY